MRINTLSKGARGSTWFRTRNLPALRPLSLPLRHRAFTTTTFDPMDPRLYQYLTLDLTLDLKPNIKPYRHLRSITMIARSDIPQGWSKYFVHPVHLVSKSYELFFNTIINFALSAK